LRGRRSIALDRATLQACDAVLVVTDHDAVDYRLIAEHARLVVDTRNVLARQGVAADHIIKA
jgi:UDP-N-acetyl-D-glucosamine dehydrogenase